MAIKMASAIKKKVEKKNLFFKISLFLIVFAFVLIMHIPGTSALIYHLETKCEYETCVIGENVTWKVVLENEGDARIEVTAFELIDYFSTKSIASYLYAGQPTSIYNEAPGGVKIPMRTNATIYLYGVLPKPYEYRKLIYFPCFNIAIRQGDIYHQPKDIRELRYCSKVNETLYVVPCLSDNDCMSYETCDLNNCIEFGCGDCEYAFEHNCKSYECCSSDQCDGNEYCSENNCTKLLCSETQLAINHSCSSLQCREDQYIANSTCIDLECQLDEAGINHECQKLQCAYDEYLVPNACAKLNCSQTQGYVNNTCYDLSCTESQEYFNHTCRDIHCFFWQDIANHQCINNRNKIAFFSLEASIVLLIAAILLLDIFKLRSKIQGL